MKIALRNLAIFLGAALISAALYPIGFLTTLTKAVLTANQKQQRPVVYVGESALSIALSLDLTGNVICKDLMNLIFIKPEGHLFGDNRETISSVLGKNKATGTLRFLGRKLADLLNWIQPNHVELAAGTLP
ncbi:hypothetical protein WBJ53_26175 [Spirosoma sp. SC4-14]|uniref:hypothetical protein n=1 Tax=Spirosoma sp. SC4-14 TaxID=3128900 RepID=UPI0030D5251F